MSEAKSKIKTLVLLVVLLAAVVAVIKIVLVFISIYYSMDDNGVTITDVSQYESMFDTPDVRTAFIVFPEHILEGAKECEYKYVYDDGYAGPNYLEVFLQCTYDEDTYKAEVERLENICLKQGDVENKLLKEESDRYPYTAYIAVEYKFGYYEYALLTSENQITYICAAHREVETTSFDKGYLPKDYPSRAAVKEDNFQYSVYELSKGKYNYRRD